MYGECEVSLEKWNVSSDLIWVELIKIWFHWTSKNCWKNIPISSYEFVLYSGIKLYYTRYYTHGIKIFYKDSIKKKKNESVIFSYF
jgi:hypothetical protein